MSQQSPPTQQEYNPTALLRQAFPSLEPGQVAFLASLSRVKSYSPGELLCTEGAFEDTFYLVFEGEVEVTKKVTDDKERIVRQGGPGDWFGEIALIQQGRRSANVRAVTDTVALEVDRDTFAHVLKHSPSMALTMMHTMVNRIRSNDRSAINELREAYETLQRMDQTKLAFIEIAAHELRTPITDIQGYADMLRFMPQIANDPGLMEIVEGVRKGSDRLLEIVNSMLDISKIDSDVLEVSQAPVLLKVLLEDIISRFGEALQQRNITVAIERGSEAITLRGDPKLLNKVFTHVIMNAIKYTPDGGHITITVQRVSAPKSGEAAQIAIRDTGIGIDAKDQQLIFEKFYQIGEVALHSSSQTAFKGGGPGLGLAIAKGIVEAHGGKIWCESPGHDEERMPGSTITVLLPIMRMEG